MVGEDRHSTSSLIIFLKDGGWEVNKCIALGEQTAMSEGSDDSIKRMKVEGKERKRAILKSEKVICILIYASK